MLSITDGGSLSRALSSPIADRLKRLLTTRLGQLDGQIDGHAHLVIMQPGDPLPALHVVLGFSPFHNPIDGRSFGQPDFTPAWEWIEDHGFCFELAFIFDDGGFAHVLIVESAQGVAPELLSLCRTYVNFPS